MQMGSKITAPASGLGHVYGAMNHPGRELPGKQRGFK